MRFRFLPGAVLGLLLLSTLPVTAQMDVYDLESDKELALGATGIGLFGVGYLIDRGFEALTPEEIAALDPAQVNRLDRTATDNWSPGAARASDYLVHASLAAPLTLMLSQPGRDQADLIGIMYVETYLLNSGLTYLLKNALGRTRPFAYNRDPDIPSSLRMSHTARRSFPSGHTSTAFASLVFLATVHSRLNPDSSANGWVWGGCLAAAATTGYLRYAAGMHFPTDIIAGATLGAFAGWIVPQMHEVETSVIAGADKRRPAGQTVIGFSLGF